MVKILSTQMDKQMETQLKPHGLSLGSFAILMTLLEQDGLNQRQIGQKISMPGYATTRNLDKLEENEWVVRKADPNSRRAYLIFLTPSAREKAPELFSIVQKVNQSFLEKLDDNDKQQLERVLAKIIRAK